MFCLKRDKMWLTNIKYRSVGFSFRLFAIIIASTKLSYRPSIKTTSFLSASAQRKLPTFKSYKS